MKQIVAISAFAEMLARQSGYTVDFCERFTLEMFKTIADELKESDSVTIKGLGRFYVTEKGNVEFSPDTNFAADVNAPFDCFEPEILADEITERQLLNGLEPIAIEENIEEGAAVETPIELLSDNLDGENDIEVDTPSLSIVEDNKIESVEEQEIPIEDDDFAEEKIVDVVEEASVSGQNVAATIIVTNEVAESTTNNTESIENTVPHRRRSIATFIGGVLLGGILGAAITYYVVIPKVVADNAMTESPTIDIPVAITDSISNEIIADSINSAVQESIIVEDSEITNEVYDYVTSTLAQLSRKHFGTYEFWVYIYEENKDVISDPDLVEPNTKVRIPNAAKYGIDANNRTSINNALNKSQEIARQRKK